MLLYRNTDENFLCFIIYKIFSFYFLPLLILSAENPELWILFSVNDTLSLETISL